MHCYAAGLSAQASLSAGQVGHAWTQRWLVSPSWLARRLYDSLIHFIGVHHPARHESHRHVVARPRVCRAGHPLCSWLPACLGSCRCTADSIRPSLAQCMLRTTEASEWCQHSTDMRLLTSAGCCSLGAQFEGVQGAVMGRQHVSEAFLAGSVGQLCGLEFRPYSAAAF